MGLLNTYFYAADDAEAAELADVLGGPSGYEAGGFTGLELDTLQAVITGVPDADIAEASVRYVGEPGEEWLFAIRPELVAALAGLEDDAIEPVAATWAQTDELAIWKLADLTEVLQVLVGLASRSTPNDQLYFWGSL